MVVYNYDTSCSWVYMVVLRLLRSLRFSSLRIFSCLVFSAFKFKKLGFLFEFAASSWFWSSVNALVFLVSARSFWFYNFLISSRIFWFLTVSAVFSLTRTYFWKLKFEVKLFSFAFFFSIFYFKLLIYASFVISSYDCVLTTSESILKSSWRFSISEC